jgi:hypothetical protein
LQEVLEDPDFIRGNIDTTFMKRYDLKNAPASCLRNLPVSAEFYKIPNVPFLYPILDSSLSTDLLKDAADILRAGARILQIRAKNKDRRFVYEAVQGLIPLVQEYRVPLMVNDYVDVVLVTDASGVHIGQTDLPPDVCRRLLPAHVIGFSTHTMESSFWRRSRCRSTTLRLVSL